MCILTSKKGNMERERCVKNLKGRDLIVGLPRHVKITSQEVREALEQAAGENLPSNYGDLLRKILEVQEIAARTVDLKTISSLDHIDAVAPAIERGVLVSYRNKEYQWCMLKGIDPKREMKIGKFREYVDKNMDVEKEFSKTHGGEPPVLMGRAVLRTEGVAPGQSVEITTSPAAGNGGIVTKSFYISGFTQSGGFDIDRRECYVPLAAAQEMLGLKSDEITHVRLQVTDQRRLTDVKFAAARALTGFEFKRREERKDEERVMFGNYFIMSWREKKANEIFAARNDLKILSFIVVFIFIGAGFVTMAILVMMVFEKRKDIGVLKAVGCSRHGVVALFLLMGLIIGLSGSVLGMVSGILASDNINEIADVVEKISGREVFSKDVYYLDEIPAHLAPDAVWKIFLVATGVGLVSSVAAAGRAAVIEPVRALRYE